MTRVGDVLKAAALLSGLTVREIAERSGLRRSRVKRLLACATIPREIDLQQILGACGCDPSLLTSPATSKTLGFTWLPLLLRSRVTTASVEDQHASLSIDKISLTFDVLDSKRFVNVAKRQGEAFHSQRAIYENEFRCDEVLVQHGANSDKQGRVIGRRSSRLEFNPRLVRPADNLERRRASALIRKLLSHALKATMRVSRIDVAVDVPLSLRDLQVLGTSRQKANVFIGRHGVETIYVGARGSERQIRMYDRRQRLIDTENADVRHPEQTRIEAQLRNLGLTVDQLPALRNPFRDLRLLSLEPSSLRFAQRVLVEYARTFGLPALRAQLSRDEFGILAQQLEQTSSFDPAHPSDVFTRNWSATIAPLGQFIAEAMR